MTRRQGSLRDRDEPLEMKEAEELVAMLEALCSETADIEHYQHFVRRLLHGYTARAPRLPPGLQLFRSRQGMRCETLRNLSYPPVEAVTSLGRANRVSDSVFYCTSSRVASAFEWRPEVGECGTISKWVSDDELSVIQIGYTAESFTTYGSAREVPEFAAPSNSSPRSALDNYITEALSRFFTRKVEGDRNHQYKCSIAVAEVFLEGTPLIKGILYPTLAMSAAADNLALRTSTVDASLRPVRAEFVRIEDVHPDNRAYTVTMLDTATEFTPEGTIKWKGRRDRWQLSERRIFSVEDGVIVARDEKGTLIDPD